MRRTKQERADRKALALAEAEEWLSRRHTVREHLAHQQETGWAAFRAEEAVKKRKKAEKALAKASTPQALAKAGRRRKRDAAAARELVRLQTEAAKKRKGGVGRAVLGGAVIGGWWGSR